MNDVFPCPCHGIYEMSLNDVSMCRCLNDVWMSCSNDVLTSYLNDVSMNCCLYDASMSYCFYALCFDLYHAKMFSSLLHGHHHCWTYDFYALYVCPCLYPCPLICESYVGLYHDVYPFHCSTMNDVYP